MSFLIEHEIDLVVGRVPAEDEDQNENENDDSDEHDQDDQEENEEEEDDDDNDDGDNDNDNDVPEKDRGEDGAAAAAQPPPPPPSPVRGRRIRRRRRRRRRDDERYKVAIEMGIFQRLSFGDVRADEGRPQKISTTNDLIRKIQDMHWGGERGVDHAAETTTTTTTATDDSSKTTMATTTTKKNAKTTSTETIDATKNRDHDENDAVHDPQRKPRQGQGQEPPPSRPAPTRFGDAVAAHVPPLDDILLRLARDDDPLHPRFPSTLLEVMEPHIEKARKRREAALDSIRAEAGETRYDAITSDFARSGLMREVDFDFDTDRWPLREAFMESVGVMTMMGTAKSSSSSSSSSSFDLALLHQETTMPSKERLLRNLTRNPLPFQRVYDQFVRQVCVPRLAACWDGLNIDNSHERHRDEHDDDDGDEHDDDGDTIYYQSFPCVRIVRPGEFSIGPHADVMYGHHPCSINVYVPLTDIIGTSSSSLFLESSPGREDWHPIRGRYGRSAKQFAGGQCLHFTTINATDRTRVSLDFRFLVGRRAYHSLPTSSSSSMTFSTTSMMCRPRDVYRERGGYYASCTRPPRSGSSSSSSSSSRRHTTTSSSRTRNTTTPTMDPPHQNNWEEQQQQCKQERQEEEEDNREEASVVTPTMPKTTATTASWIRQDGPYLKPDERMGFPWTVKNWDKVLGPSP